MQIGRLHIGFIRQNNKIIFELFEYEYACCKCHILTILGMCFTWMGDECLMGDIDND